MRSSTPWASALALCATVALLALPSAAAAHDLWLEQAGPRLLLRYGHRGGDLMAIERARVTSLRCVEPEGARDLLAQATFAPREISAAARCAVAAAAFDGGTWSLTPDGEVNRPRTEVPDAVKAWTSRQFAKWVDARSPAASATVVGDELELVLVGDASRARAGDKVTLRVLSAGRPVAGAVVAIDHRPLGETDEAGETRLRLRSAGVETVSATWRRALKTPEADALVLEASLSFEVAR
jgi:uncharacterized GH25 family protein